MNDYFLFTRKRDYEDHIKRVLYLCAYPLRTIFVAIVIILTPLLCFSLLQKKNREVWIDFWKYIKSSFVLRNILNSYASYNCLMNNVCVNLERYEGLSENGTIDEFTNLITHEDIHKCLRFNLDGDQEFIIRKMGY